MWIDTHCHLDASEFDADRDDVAASALKEGVSRIVIPGVERQNFDRVRELGVSSLNSSGPLASFGLATALGYGDMISNRVVDAIGDGIGFRVRVWRNR